MARQIQNLPEVMKFKHAESEVPKHELCNECPVHVQVWIVTAEEYHSKRGDLHINLLLVNNLVVPILLPCLFFEAEELLTVRVVPDPQLELLLIHVNEV